MKIKNTFIEGVYIIENFFQNDVRGSFNKIFNYKFLKEYNLDIDIKEVYYSTSQKDVIRGMHFQIPPYEHSKLIHIIKGEVMDVIVDIRKSSSTYGKVLEYKLNSERKESIYIPKGCAHGFKTLKDNTEMLYLVTSEYSKECDCGIKWDSIDYNWNIEKPIISARDNSFKEFKDFISPF